MARAACRGELQLPPGGTNIGVGAYIGQEWAGGLILKRSDKNQRFVIAGLLVKRKYRGDGHLCSSLLVETIRYVNAVAPLGSFWTLKAFVPTGDSATKLAKKYGTQWKTRSRKLDEIRRAEEAFLRRFDPPE